MPNSKTWFLYILECKDGSLYTGITPDLESRINSHEKGIGAKYTQGRGPFILRYKTSFNNRSEASKAEFKIKSLSRAQKLELIESQK